MLHQTDLSPSVGVQTWHEPRSFQAFQCTGAACEDTCCAGWGIGVDRQTYDRYQQVEHPELGPKLRRLVNITAHNKGDQHAAIQLADAQCPLLAEKLCSVHKELGAEYLGQACATFPRVVNQVEGAVERSLDLSCPEAARLVLLNPEPTFFEELRAPVELSDSRLLQIASSRQPRSDPPYFDAVRGFTIEILQNRRYPISKRMMLLAFFCAKLQELEDNGTRQQTPQVLEGFQYAIQAGLFDDHLRQTSAQASTQLALVLEMVVARISLDYTSQRYRDLYGEFMEGLSLKTDSNMAELGERYANANFMYFEPFLIRREYILEHYLVSYAYKTLLPYGNSAIAEQYIVMASYFAIIRSLAIGLAGKYKSEFQEMHLVRSIQVCARALEHCTSFPARLLEILASKGIRMPAAMAVLTQNLAMTADTFQAELSTLGAGLEPFTIPEYASGK